MKNYLLILALITLSACGGGGSSSTVPPIVPAPTVAITFSAQKVWVGDTVKVTWASSNANSCTGIDGFSGVLPINGTLDFKPTASGQFKYTLSCTGTGGTGSGTQTVSVDATSATFTANITQKSADANSLGYEKTNQTNTLGDWIFNTGIWGVNSADAYSEKQVGVFDFQNKAMSMSMDWDVKPSDKIGIVLFGNATFGKHPGSTTSSTARLPVQINNMPDVMLSGTVKTTCLTTCGFGTIFDVFVMSSPNSVSTDIGTEILIVTENSTGKPDSGHVGTTIINGIEFKVYRNAFPTAWSTIGYSPVNQYSEVKLNMKDFMTDAVNRGYIKPSDYLVSIEVGTEVVRGKGNTTISNFKVQ
jgi:hypothetical protein